MRLGDKDCNAGVIFDNLNECDMFPSALVGLRLIM